MDIKGKKIVSAILRILKDSRKPIGGTKIAGLISRYGISISHRTVRHYLLIMDKQGLTKKSGEHGRFITHSGLEELSKLFVFDKVGLVASRIDELSYKMKFSASKLKGRIILNISAIDSKNCRKLIEIIKFIFRKGLGMGNFLVISDKKNVGDFVIPRGKTAIGTVCSVTINGILLNAGIPVVSRFGGLLEIREGVPVRFTEIISYDGSTLDPLEIFIKGKMTSVWKAAKTGSGIIGASFREIPAIAVGDAVKIKKKLDKIGLNGILLIGNPGQPLLDIPVAEGKAGMVVLGGLNPLAAVEEHGIETNNVAMGTLFEFSELTHYTNLRLRKN